MSETEHLKNKIRELKNELEVYKKALVMMNEAFDYTGDSKMDEFFINKAKESLNENV